MLKGVSLQLKIIEFIKKYITENDLKDGDKLPSQKELTDLLGVSKSSLREAVKTLEANNILEVINGKGVYVKNSSMNIITSQISFKKEKESILELLHVRKILEKEVIKLFIKNAQESEIQEIEDILKVIMTKYKNGEKQNKEDKEFHTKIYSCCHNKALCAVIFSIKELLVELWNFPLGLADPFTDTIPLHEDLFYALKNRDIRKAQQINTKILNNIISQVKKAELNKRLKSS